MENGWIKLYRRSIDSRVFRNEGLLKIWIWCLLKANHSTQWVSLKTGKGSIEVECKEGQFIFGRHSAAKELNMEANTVWKRMNKLKNLGNCNIKSNRQYSIITIMNWSTYQSDEIKSNIKSNRQVTGKQQASNTNKNEKNEKNEKKKSYGIFNNVKLTNEELFKLKEKFSDYTDKIEKLGEYIKSTGKRYKCHYATILSWDRRYSKKEGGLNWLP